MTPIALVGWATRLPGIGTDPAALWRAVAGAADLSTDVPAGRWLRPPELCLDPRVPHPDSVYSARGYYLDPFTLDPRRVNMPAGLLGQLDPLYHLVLDVGHRAWKSAKTDRTDRRRAGVVLGNICLPTDAASDLALQYIGDNKPVEPVHPLNRYVAGLPAGLLAKSLGLGAGTFTLDAACASTLYAIKLAADELQSGRAELMLAGGANRSDCLYTQMGFAQLRALSASGRCSPFSSVADGLMVGEGATVFVLKRLPDAERDGDTIHAVIRGWGLSNDTHGNLLAPAKEGQLRAMHAAYRMAGWQPNEVDLIECHATGTPVGDAVEFESLRELWNGAGGRCVIGSVKSTVGHLLTGAGGPAVAKVLLALASKTLPPQANFADPHPALDFAGSPFRVLAKPEPWKMSGAGIPRRAAVSGFGFGGVNAHLLLEEYRPDDGPKLVLPGASVSVGLRRDAVPAAEPVAVVGMAAHVGPWEGLVAFAPAALGLEPPRPPVPKRNGWADTDAACPPGQYVETVTISRDRFRIPPRELEDMLPQQLLMLAVAADALKDAETGLASGGRKPPIGAEKTGSLRPSLAEEHHLRTGVFVGLGLDLNTTNFHVRWCALDSGSGTTEPLFPPLTADRTLGALGSIAASRIARAFHFGGPSFTCCSEESSAGTAVALAVRALRLNEIDRAVVGGVDLAGDPRQLRASSVYRPVNGLGATDPLGESETGVVPGEGAAAVVLKRLSDAERDGDRVYAVIRGVGTASGGAAEAAAPDAATYASSFMRACADAGTNPAAVDYLEGVGSGCAADDKPEADAVSALLNATARDFPLAIGCGRGRFGHTGAASGLVGLVRAALALHHQTLPPTVSADRVHPSDKVYASRAARFWLADRGTQRRAAVAATGTDGSSVHIVLEEFAQETAPAVSALAPLPEALFVVDGGVPPEVAERLHQLDRLAEEFFDWPALALATRWHRVSPPHPQRKYAVTLVARSVPELRTQLAVAREAVTHRPEAPLMPDPSPAVRDRVFYSPNPLGLKAQIAFVFPGSGNQFAGMGRDLSGWFPDVFRRQQAENESLRGQFAPAAFWGEFIPPDTHARAFLFGQVTLGAAVADILVSLGVKPAAMVGLSLGESAGLFGVRAWAGRDEMFHRIQKSSLFDTDLGPPFDSAKRAWAVGALDWVTGVVSVSADDVRSKLRPGLRAYLLIVNTPTECVVGGDRRDVERLVAALGKPFVPLSGVTLAHCEAGKPVERPYHELHTLPVTQPGVRVYSGAWGRQYQPTSTTAADSITAGLLNTIDFPAVVSAAYRDGVRAFVEVGPGASCTRMIPAILGDRPHLVRAVTPPRQDAVSALMRTLAALIAERLPIDVSKLPTWEPPTEATPSPSVAVTVGRAPPFVAPPITPPVPPPPPELVATPKPVPTPRPVPPPMPEVVPTPATPVVLPPLPDNPFVTAALRGQAATAAAHEQFLRLQAGLTQTALAAAAVQQELVRQLVSRDHEGAHSAGTGSASDGLQHPAAHAPGSDRSKESAPSRPRLVDAGVPRSLTFVQCTEYAVGKIARVLGDAFAEVDAFPTRVRLPEGPLMLVDRVLLIEGEPKSMTSGRVVTDHTVHADRWYLDNGRCPTSITVESGQADLFLSGFLGIDFQTRGLAVYRLLDAVVTFHRELPRVGERIEYDIRIDGFFRQADAWLFRFRFEGTIGGEPLLSMANGVAGFFTAAALAAGQGIIHTKLDKQPMPGTKPDGWQPLVPFEKCALTAAQVAALHTGDIATAFGPLFADLPLTKPMPLPAGMLKLVDRVPVLDPTGGRFGLGFVRAEYDIKPSEWFIECHFVDDKVMPGTLMYECCLHTLRVLLVRMGWIGEAGEVTCEPVPGVASRLKCRGQVLDTTKLVTYEVSVKELGFRPEPFCIADALMYADGKPIVEITNLSLRMSGLTASSLADLWQRRGAGVGDRASQEAIPDTRSPTPAKLVYGPDSIRAFAIGNPSEAFGEPYRVFDRDRIIARLPGPPYQFLDRVTSVIGEPFVLKDGASCVAEYDVPAEEWYFAANRCPRMPFSVLLEVALQPCGWLAAYCGSALTSDVDLSFRNLGGKGTQLAEVSPDIGTLTTAVTMTKVSKSAGMIIQHYDMKVTAAGGRPVYEGTTYFGFFAKDALRNQVGITGAKVPYLTDDQLAFAESGQLPHDPPFPDAMLRMVDHIDGYLPRGGRAGLGLIQGRIVVDPTFWFFKAHFHQDPVWPGSLGVESFLQLLKFVAWKKWKAAPPGGWQVAALNAPHEWVYRGQVLPTDREVTVVLEVTAADDMARRLTADGFLTVDGRVIYQMARFVLE